MFIKFDSSQGGKAKSFKAFSEEAAQKNSLNENKLSRVKRVSEQASGAII